LFWLLRHLSVPSGCTLRQVEGRHGWHSIVFLISGVCTTPYCFVAVNKLSQSLLRSPGFPVQMAFSWWMIHRDSSNKGKWRASRSSQGSATMKRLLFPFLSSTSRNLVFLGASDVALITECLQDRGGATHLLDRILLSQSNRCPD
jgi:hypothetical protein